MPPKRSSLYSLLNPARMRSSTRNLLDKYLNAKVINYFKKRGYRKRGIPYTPRLTGFPVSQAVKLRWVDVVTLDPTISSAPALHRFRANSINQPDRTGATTHQPRGHDQWAQVYDHYTVIGSKIMVQAYSETSPGTPGVFGLYLDDTNANTFASVPDAIETTGSRGRYRMVGRDTNLTAGSSPRLSHKFSAKKFFNKDTKSMLGDTHFSGSLSGGTNPAEEADYILWYGNVAGEDPKEMRFIVTIDYFCILTEPRKLPSS